MGSRIRENVKRFFECFCEVAPPSKDKEAWIIQQFPEKFKQEVVLKSVPSFTYPYKFENSVIQHYSFVLTDSESKWTFGFGRHDPKSETAIVVLSYLPWHQAFYKFLDTIAILMHSPSAEELRDFLSVVYDCKIPEPGKCFSVPFSKGERIFAVEVPQPFQLPSIPENRNLTEYYNAVDTNNMMNIFASMLFERRIIFTSKKLQRLSACVQSANDLIYPMVWQHIFIPVLPMSLIGYLSAPMPYLIGVPSEVLKEVNLSELGDVIILDADENTIETPFSDLNSMPHEITTSLKKQLKNKTATLLGDGVSRAFLRTLVHLIGGYRDALTFQPAQKVTFNQDKFIETRHSTLQPFLRKMLQLQIFQQFIEDRLTMLNEGLGFSDEFELEIFRHSEKSGSKLKQQYREWTATMKKEGTAFFRTFKDKTNPAMKSAVRTVKDGGKGVKSAYRGLRSRLRDSQGPQQLHNGHEASDDKPRSAPSSPTEKQRNVGGFTIQPAPYRKETALPFKASSNDTAYVPLNTSQSSSSSIMDMPGDGSPTNLEIPRIDLMNEMQDLLQLHLEIPPVDRSLKPVRSLENFKHISPGATPDRSAYHSRSSVPSAHTNHFFSSQSNSQDMQNLLQSPDDIFSSPPVTAKPSDPFSPSPSTMTPLHGYFPYGASPCSSSRDRGSLYGATPFVVGGGHNENGDSLFLVASQHKVDVVKLVPPLCSPRRKQQADDTEDLIRLDSTSDDMDDFDPLKSGSSYQLDGQQPQVLSVSNPLYTYDKVTENGNVPKLSKAPISSKNDQDLLQEYGLYFNSFANTQFDSFSSGNSANSKVTSINKWTRFD